MLLFKSCLALTMKRSRQERCRVLSTPSGRQQRREISALIKPAHKFLGGSTGPMWNAPSFRGAPRFALLLQRLATLSTPAGAEGKVYAKPVLALLPDFHVGACCQQYGVTRRWTTVYPVDAVRRRLVGKREISKPVLTNSCCRAPQRERILQHTHPPTSSQTALTSAGLLQ